MSWNRWKYGRNIMNEFYKNTHPTQSFPFHFYNYFENIITHHTVSHIKKNTNNTFNIWNSRNILLSVCCIDIKPSYLYTMHVIVMKKTLVFRDFNSPTRKYLAPCYPTSTRVVLFSHRLIFDSRWNEKKTVSTNVRYLPPKRGMVVFFSLLTMEPVLIF